MTRTRVIVAATAAILVIAGAIPAGAQVAPPMVARDGDNTIFFTWDAAAGEITQATSSRRIVAGQQVELLTSISDEDARIVARAVLKNTSDGQSYAVEGRLKHRIMKDGEVIRTLKSRPIARVLRPGEKVKARFDYTLESGDYSARTDYTT